MMYTCFDSNAIRDKSMLLCNECQLFKTMNIIKVKSNVGGAENLPNKSESYNL